jgi:hypothetical protein
MFDLLQQAFDLRQRRVVKSCIHDRSPLMNEMHCAQS